MPNKSIRDLAKLMIERRKPYASEDAFFKKNPHVGGMAAADNRVILNPYAPLSESEREAVALNEAARIYMRQAGSPEIPITPEQARAFQNYGSQRDMRETILARILSGDPSAGEITQEQALYVDEVLRKRVGAPKRFYNPNIVGPRK